MNQSRIRWPAIYVLNPSRIRWPACQWVPLLEQAPRQPSEMTWPSQGPSCRPLHLKRKRKKSCCIALKGVQRSKQVLNSTATAQGIGNLALSSFKSSDSESHTEVCHYTILNTTNSVIRSATRESAHTWALGPLVGRYGTARADDTTGLLGHCEPWKTGACPRIALTQSNMSPVRGNALVGVELSNGTALAELWKVPSGHQQSLCLSFRVPSTGSHSVQCTSNVGAWVQERNLYSTT